MDFFADGHAVEEGWGGENCETVEVVDAGEVVGEDLGIHQGRVELVVAGGVADGLGEFGAGFFEVDGGGEFAGAHGVGCFFAEDCFLNVLGPASIGLSKSAHEHVDDAFGEVDFGGVGEEVFRFQVLGDEKHGEVADHFTTGGDLDDVAEDLVDVGVGVRDFLPAMTEAHGVGLLLEVGVLAAGHLVEIDFGGAAARERSRRARSG